MCANWYLLDPFFFVCLVGFCGSTGGIQVKAESRGKRGFNGLHPRKSKRMSLGSNISDHSKRLIFQVSLLKSYVGLEDLEESFQKWVENLRLKSFFVVQILVFWSVFAWEQSDPGVCLRACNKNESHETCSCQYLVGGLLGDTNRLGGEGGCACSLPWRHGLFFLHSFWRFPK